MVDKKSNFISSKTLLIGIALFGLIGLAVLLLWRSPCDDIFAQTAPELKVNLKFIENEGSVAVSRETIQELSESAQKVGLHLKTCCSVLERGKVDPEQFQQCIDTASAYDRKIALVAHQVKEVTEAKEMGAKQISQEKIESIKQAIQTATAEAENFSQVKLHPQPPKPTPVTPSMRVLSQIAGVSAELVEFSRFENTITLKLRFVNTGKEDRKLSPSYYSGSSYLLDEATGKRYERTTHADEHVSVPAGGSVEFWTKYLLPEGDKPRFLSAILDHGILLEHLKAP